MRVEKTIVRGKHGTNRRDPQRSVLRWRPRVRSYSSRLAMLGFVLLYTAAAASGAQPDTRRPLPEATVLDGVDGLVVPTDANDGWLFELAADVNTPSAKATAGSRLPLLPSVILAKLIDDVNDRYTPRYRLTAYVTQYRGRDYLFPTYYLPLSKLQDAESSAPQQEQTPQPVGPIIESDPNFAIPAEILEKLRDRRPIRGPQRNSEQRERQTQDTELRSRNPLGRMLVDRVGLIEQEDGRWFFTPYALGWNVSDVRYELLPCTTLERTERLQATLLEPTRFNVAGFVTQFRGRMYLLLRRAAPVYNYGNFGR
jgi:hypothetical protein